MGELTEFEGIPVAAVGVEMPNAAGGLQEAMKFQPVEWHHGDEGYIVLHYSVAKVRFDPITRGDIEPLRRIHVLHVDEAAPISGDQVAEHLAEQREAIARAKEEADGVQRLDLDDDDAGGEDEDVSQRHRNDDPGDEGAA